MRQLEEDNVYPRNSSHFIKREPDAQREEREQETKKVAENIPVIERLIKHLDERIAYFSSVDSITFDVLRSPNEHMHTVVANKLTKEVLTQERENLMAELSEHKK